MTSSKSRPWPDRDEDGLDDLNRSFYEDHAQAFSHTRQRAWPGWQRVLSALDRSLDSRPLVPRPRALDVACGNGRFFDCLRSPDGEAAHRRREIVPIGLERSWPLLWSAREQRSEAGSSRHHVRWLAADARRPPLRDGSIHLVTAFGLLHHLPGAAARSDLIDGLAALVEAGGLLALSFWQFDRVPGIVGRAVPWETARHLAQDHGLDLPAPEQGDYLLPWGPSEEAFSDPERRSPSLRFCHSTTDEEIEAHAQRLESTGQWQLADSFPSDGRTQRLNRYLILRRRPVDGPSAPSK